jgi:hypothetical protein
MILMVTVASDTMRNRQRLRFCSSVWCFPEQDDYRWVNQIKETKINCQNIFAPLIAVVKLYNDVKIINIDDYT